MDIEHIDTVSERGDGLNLHDYLRGCWPFLNKPCWQQLIADLTLEIDGISLASAGDNNPKLKRGQALHYWLRDYSEDTVDCDWKLLWDGERDRAQGGEDIIAVHKPANLPVSRTTRNFYNTLIRLVRRDSDWPDAHLLHRLDLDTAGIILLGKNNAAASYWQPKLQQLLQRKVYQAVVYGKPNWIQTELECRLATRTEHPIRCQMHACDDGEKGKLSRTGFKLVRSSGDYSIIECELFTGRKHQIRAHLAHLGHPIVGDKIYSNNGEFYLKRLNDEDTDNDHAKLMTEHHLLMAQRVELNPLTDPAQPRASNITIINPHYPPAWIEFCSRAGLLE